jgi:hypothetical protein
MTTLFKMPDEILSKIYQMDDTYRNVFANGTFKYELKRAAIKIFIKRSIATTIRSDGRPAWQHIDHWMDVDRDQCSFGPEFKVHLHPTFKHAQYHTKYKIIRKNVDPNTIDINSFDGFVSDAMDYFSPPRNSSDRTLNYDEKVVMQYFELDKVLGVSLYKKDKNKTYEQERDRQYRWQKRDYCRY